MKAAGRDRREPFASRGLTDGFEVVLCLIADAVCASARAARRRSARNIDILDI